MIEAKNIHIVLPISNIRGWTDVCLQSLYRQQLINELKITFIFNGTNKSIKKKILENYTPTNIIEFDTNIGMVAALNKAMKAVNEEWILILHNDTVMPKNFISDFITSSNRILEKDDTVIGFLPTTNYSIERALRLDQDTFDAYQKVKPSNKSVLLEDDVKNILTLYYNNGLDGLESLDYFYDDFFKLRHKLFSYLSEISHYCLLFKKETYELIGPFDEDFYPISHFEKIFFEDALINGYGFVLLKDVYIHHNGNTSSDFFGFNFPDIFANNEKIYNNKIKERSEKLYNKNIKNIDIDKGDNVTESSESRDVIMLGDKVSADDLKQKKTALFVYLGGADGLLDILEVGKQFKKAQGDFEISLLCNEDYVDFVQNSNVFDLVLGSDISISFGMPQAKLDNSIQLYNKMFKEYDFVKDWSRDIVDGVEIC